MVAYAEFFTAFLLGIAIVALTVWLMKIRKKGLFWLLINAAAGFLILILLNLFGIVALPINPFNALICGIFGVFGILFIYATVIFL